MSLWVRIKTSQDWSKDYSTHTICIGPGLYVSGAIQTTRTDCLLSPLVWVIPPDGTPFVSWHLETCSLEVRFSNLPNDRRARSRMLMSACIAWMKKPRRLWSGFSVNSVTGIMESDNRSTISNVKKWLKKLSWEIMIKW